MSKISKLLKLWSEHPAAERVGGVIVETENGFQIIGANQFNFASEEIVPTDIHVELDETEPLHSIYRISFLHAVTDSEYLYEEKLGALIRVVNSMALAAPPPSFLNMWNDSDLAQKYGPAEQRDSALIISNVEWSNPKSELRYVGDLYIYFHAKQSSEPNPEEQYHSFIICHEPGTQYVGNLHLNTFSEIQQALAVRLK